MGPRRFATYHHYSTRLPGRKEGIAGPQKSRTAQRRSISAGRFFGRCCRRSTGLLGGAATETINLHGLGLAEVRARLPEALADARRHGERVIRIIHGQGKHSEAFPVLKSFVRRWLEESDLARREVGVIFRGEDGSPYTPPNAGETIVVLRGPDRLEALPAAPPSVMAEEEEREARRQTKALRAERNRIARRRGPRR